MQVSGQSHFNLKNSRFAKGKCCRFSFQNPELGKRYRVLLAQYNSLSAVGRTRWGVTWAYRSNVPQEATWIYPLWSVTNSIGLNADKINSVDG